MLKGLAKAAATAIKPRPFKLQYASNLFAYQGKVAPEELLKPAAAPYLALLGNTLSVDGARKRHATREFLEFCEGWKRS